VKVSVQVDYACRVMAELARLHGSGELARIEHLAETEAVPANFLGQILLKLRNHGLIRSRRGSRGGYTLARPPEEISVLDVLIAVDGHCLQLSGNHSGRSGRRMRQVWTEIAGDIEAKARALTFDQIASREPDTMYYI
jgi:Rrf2 family cysteine metabolism transcriptional repressor